MAMVTAGTAKNGVLILKLANADGNYNAMNVNMRGTSYQFQAYYDSDYDEGETKLVRGSTVLAGNRYILINGYYRFTLSDSSIKVEVFSTQPPVTDGTPLIGYTLSATDSDFLISGTWQYDASYYSFVSFTSNDSSTYTVNYNANGGSVSPTSAVYSGTALTLPTPTRAGYTFDGWFTAATGGAQVSSPYEPDANVTLYAHWTQDKVRTLESFNAPVLNAQSLGVDVQRVYSLGVLVWER